MRKSPTHAQRCYGSGLNLFINVVYWETRGHGQEDTNKRTNMENTGRYGKYGQLWERSFKDGQLYKRRAVM